ncbi:unnamed protein product [Effrenium voratum]|nr:unnamed protein product [Effrenium voratum]
MWAKELRELRKKLGFIFALKLGVPEVGLGTNRKDFFFKVSAALAAGIRMGRKTKGKRLPRNMWDFFLRAVKQLNRDANEAAEQKAQVAAPCLTAGEARFRIDKGMLVGLPDMGQLEHNVPEEVKEAVETEGNPALPQAEEDLTGLSPEMEDRTFGVLSMLSLQGSQNPQVATKAAQALRAITAAEPGARAVASFGGVEVLLSLAQLASEGAVTANARAQDKKGRGKSGFGFRIPQGSSRNTSARAVEALGFGKSARRGDGTDLPPESARGDFSPKSARRRGKDESPPMSARGGTSPRSARGRRGAEDESPPMSARGRTSPRSARGRRGAEDESPPMSARGGTSPRSARGRRGAEDESLPMSARGGTSPRSARGRRGMEDDSPPMSARGGNSPMSGRKGAEEAPESGRERPTLAGLAGQEFQEFRTSEAAPSTCGACCAACCKRRRGDELADDDDDEEQGGAGGGGGKRSSGDKDSVGLYLRLADHSFAALRNLAAHSQSRKQQILEQGGEQVAVEALGAFRLQKVAENACIASAALVRNLSEGATALRPWRRQGS